MCQQLTFTRRWWILSRTEATQRFWFLLEGDLYHSTDINLLFTNNWCKTCELKPEEQYMWQALKRCFIKYTSGPLSHLKNSFQKKKKKTNQSWFTKTSKQEPASLTNQSPSVLKSCRSAESDRTQTGVLIKEFKLSKFRARYHCVWDISLVPQAETFAVTNITCSG